MNQIGIFIFYDRTGTVDGSVRYYLSALARLCTRLVVVVNGAVDAAGEAYFRSLTDEIIVRENIGYDAGAFQVGVRAVGFEALKGYDRLIIANDSVFGPVFPLTELFDEMAKRGADLWGVSGHRQFRSKKRRDNPFGYLPEHIQSYFTVYEKRLLCDPCFEAYWTELPLMRDRQQAIDRHETYQTGYFAAKGFRCDFYVPLAERNDSEDMIHGEPVRCMEEFRCPLIKKNLFAVNRYIPLGFRQALLDYVKQRTDYPAELILETVRHRMADEELTEALELLSLRGKPSLRLAVANTRLWTGTKRLVKKSRLFRALWYGLKSRLSRQ